MKTKYTLLLTSIVWAITVFSCKKDANTTTNSNDYSYLRGYWQGSFTDSVGYGLGLFLNANNTGRIYFSTSGATIDTTSAINSDGTWSVSNNSLSFSATILGVVPATCTSANVSQGQTSLSGTITFGANAGSVQKGSYSFSLKKM
jgi:hypothetical protein